MWEGERKKIVAHLKKKCGWACAAAPHLHIYRYTYIQWDTILFDIQGQCNYDMSNMNRKKQQQKKNDWKSNLNDLPKIRTIHINSMGGLRINSIWMNMKLNELVYIILCAMASAECIIIYLLWLHVLISNDWSHRSMDFDWVELLLRIENICKKQAKKMIMCIMNDNNNRLTKQKRFLMALDRFTQSHKYNADVIIIINLLLYYYCFYGDSNDAIRKFRSFCCV